ncbi:hypothetical protein KQJ29_16545, partial [Enterococcus sp. S181_ASV_20]|nr:hypothetical protein [Enterococcus sp. S181_ASV_20]
QLRRQRQMCIRDSTLTTTKGIEKEIEISKVAISDRISNGTFAIDEKQEGELFSVMQLQELDEE